MASSSGCAITKSTLSFDLLDAALGLVLMAAAAILGVDTEPINAKHAMDRAVYAATRKPMHVVKSIAVVSATLKVLRVRVLRLSVARSTRRKIFASSTPKK